MERMSSLEICDTTSVGEGSDREGLEITNVIELVAVQCASLVDNCLPVALVSDIAVLSPHFKSVFNGRRHTHSMTAEH